MNHDKRVQKTLKEINHSFLELAKTKRIDKITVKEICDYANISRSIENKDILFLLFQDEGREDLEIVANSLKEKTIPIWSQESNLNDTQLELIFTYFVNGSFAAIDYWCHHKDTIDSEQFKELFENIAKYGIYSYIYTV